MKTLKLISSQFLIALLALMAFSCGDDDTTTPTDDEMEETEEMTIAEFVSSSDDYSTLLAAVQYAGLTDALSDEDATLTVFAPNNDAFDTWLDGASLEDFTTDQVAQVLLNHVIDAELDAATVTGAVPTYQSTLATGASEGTNTSIYINSDLIINNQSEITGPDAFDASNGIIHAVDTVIDLPTIVTFATADPTFSSLVMALTRETDYTYVDLLSSNDPDNDDSPFTVFAPTNDAFADLLTELMLTSLADIETATLTATLNTHVVANANVLSTDLTDGMMVSTLGADLTVGLDPATLTDLNDRVANIIVTDVQAVNGVIHVIDTVVLPELP